MIFLYLPLSVQTILVSAADNEAGAELRSAASVTVDLKEVIDQAIRGNASRNQNIAADGADMQATAPAAGLIAAVNDDLNADIADIGLLSVGADTDGSAIEPGLAEAQQGFSSGYHNRFGEHALEVPEKVKPSPQPVKHHTNYYQLQQQQEGLLLVSGDGKSKMRMGICHLPRAMMMDYLNYHHHRP